VRIGWAQKNTTLFIGDLDGNVTTEELRQTFGQFGELVEDETFVKAGSGKFGFVRFKNRVHPVTCNNMLLYLDV
jgi:RNA recognition motif-containing protein